MGLESHHRSLEWVNGRVHHPCGRARRLLPPLREGGRERRRAVVDDVGRKVGLPRARIAERRRAVCTRFGVADVAELDVLVVGLPRREAARQCDQDVVACDEVVAHPRGLRALRELRQHLLAELRIQHPREAASKPFVAPRVYWHAPPIDVPIEQRQVAGRAPCSIRWHQDERGDVLLLQQ
eukprot:scaffold159_cov60-Phaeocystis_antarctica.AAC.5